MDPLMRLFLILEKLPTICHCKLLSNKDKEGPQHEKRGKKQRQKATFARPDPKLGNHSQNPLTL